MKKFVRKKKKKCDVMSVFNVPRKNEAENDYTKVRSKILIEITCQ